MADLLEGIEGTVFLFWTREGQAVGLGGKMRRSLRFGMLVRVGGCDRMRLGTMCDCRPP